MKNDFCTILQKPYQSYQRCFVSDSVIIITEKPFNFVRVFIFKLKGKNQGTLFTLLQRVLGAQNEKQEAKFCRTLGSYFPFLQLYTRLQKLHHLSARVACAADNCSENVVNHFVSIELTCIIIAGKNMCTRVFPFFFLPQKCAPDVLRLSFAIKLSSANRRRIISNYAEPYSGSLLRSCTHAAICTYPACSACY